MGVTGSMGIIKKPRLLIFDFDGTALGGHLPYAQFPPPFAEFLDRLAQEGIQWATNTTWSPEGQFEVIRRSGVRSLPAFLTGQTGRVLARIENDQVVFDADFAREVTARDQAFKDRVWPGIRQLFLQLLERNLVDRLAFDYYTPQCIVDFNCCPGCRDQVWNLMQPLLDSGDYYEFNPVRSDTGFLLPRHMNKGEIVTILQARLGVTPEETIVAGDASNDIHMFNPELARWLVCPANAEPLIKAHVARHGGIIAGKEFSWGVIEAVEQILQMTSAAT